MYFNSDFSSEELQEIAEFRRRKGSKDKLPRKRRRTSKRSKRSSDDDELTKYEKTNLPLRGWSNANQSSREIRGWIGTADRLARLLGR